MAARPQLAVATSFAFGSVHDSSTHARGRQLDHCGFVKWCHRASLFAKLPFFANIGAALRGGLLAPVPIIATGEGGGVSGLPGRMGGALGGALGR